MQDKTDREQGAVDVINSPASHLRHPLPGRMLGDSSQNDAACLQMQKEKHIIGHQAAPSEHLDGEEIDACQYRHMGANEVGPTHLLTTLWGRRNTKAA